VSEENEPVLIIDDEPDLCRLLSFHLEQAGFVTASASTGTGGLATAARLLPAVVILDLMLPDMPGTEVCRRMRQDPRLQDLGVLMLTARSGEDDRVEGFEVGADDYVTKPYSPREVVLRVRALARRIGERRAAKSSAEPSRGLSWRGLSVDPVRHRVLGDGSEISLRPLEFKILVLVLENPGKVFTRAELLQSAWGIGGEANPRTVDVHIRRLREALGSFGEVIETVHGFGYRSREP
jgi:two-component system phosphate regulon response regulator PhoB